MAFTNLILNIKRRLKFANVAWLFPLLALSEGDSYFSAEFFRTEFNENFPPSGETMEISNFKSLLISQRKSVIGI